MSTRTRALLWAGALICLSCGPAQSQQAPSLPLGIILGRVTSLRTGEVLSGVTVSALKPGPQGVIANVEVTTGADGTYSLGEFPAGSAYVVHFTFAGHVTRTVAVAIPDATGDYPRGNAVVEANVAMSPGDASITGKAIIAGGAPARGAVVGVDLRAQGFALVLEATAAADGTFSLTGLPASPTGLPVALVFRPYDATGDGQPDYDDYTFNTSTFPASTTRVDVDLRGAAIALSVLFSDIDDGFHPATDPINVLFNRPIDPATVTLTDTTLAREVAVTQALDAARTTLRISPGGPALSEGHNYRLVIDARGTNGTATTFSQTFQATGPTASLPAVTGLTVSPANANWNTTSFTLSWAAVNGAQGYRVFVRDTSANPAYVLVSSPGTSPTPGVAINLPASFDVFSGDATQTPFAFGTRVDFAVVPTNASGVSASPSTATAVTRTDGISPTATASQTGGANNALGTVPATVTLRVDFNEYMKQSTVPNIALPNGSLTATWAMDNGLRFGRFTITVPPGVDGRGSYTVTGAVDSSDNAMSQLTGSLL